MFQIWKKNTNNQSSLCQDWRSEYFNYIKIDTNALQFTHKFAYMRKDFEFGIYKEDTYLLSNSGNKKHAQWDTTRCDSRSDFRSSIIVSCQGAKRAIENALAMCEAKLLPSNMATTPSVVAADDVHGRSRGGDGHIKIYWILTEV
jgi:hypothetical protein